jgi:SAM-dependent methyltransferase
MPEANTYANSAELYDLDPRPVQAADLRFLVDRCTQAKAPVLELACGTGRVTIPVAAAGVRIHGLDLSPAMLAQFAAKRQILPGEVSDRITVHRGNMTSFSLAERFGLIFIPFRSFQSLTTREEQLACLRCARSHLREDGQFIIDVFRPSTTLDQSWMAPAVVDWDVIDPATGSRVVRRHVRRKIDLERQVLEIDLLYSIGGGVEFSDLLQLAFFYPPQMEALLREAGFTPVESMGDYDGRPIGEGGELIYVCRKSSD